MSTGAGTALDRAAVSAVDRTGQLGEVLDLPVHLRDALWRVDSAGLQRAVQAGPVVLAGMGGSGIGGRLAAAGIGRRALAPIGFARDYGLPSWVGPDALVLCSSYSGDTEETLACYDAARDAGARRVVATTGGALAGRARRDGVPVIPLPAGFQPRAAVGYMTVVALEVAAAAGAAPSLRDEVEAAARLAEALAAEWGPEAERDGDARALARALHGSVPVIAGAELTGPVAYRWKCQLNENAKVPAFAAELPELDHNEIVGWAAAPDFGRFAAVFLEDEASTARNRRRAELTAGLVEPGASVVRRVAARGDTPLERLFSLVLLGDLVSVYLAVLRGVDPAEIEVLERLKRALAEG